MEGVALVKDTDMNEALRFVEFLDNYPALRNFHLGLSKGVNHSHPDSKEVVGAISVGAGQEPKRSNPPDLFTMAGGDLIEGLHC